MNSEVINNIDKTINNEGDVCMGLAENGSCITSAVKKQLEKTIGTDIDLKKIKKNTGCDSEQCVVKELGIDYVLAPDGPTDTSVWLYNHTIDEYCRRLEKINKDFAYGGVLIYNFTSHLNIYKNGRIDNIIKRLENKKYFALILNTDCHGGSGQHWVSLIIKNIPSGWIYYFDSVGKPLRVNTISATNKNLSQEQRQSHMLYWVKNLKCAIKKKFGYNLPVMMNRIVHQRENDMANCGIYALLSVRLLCINEESPEIFNKRIGKKTIDLIREGKTFNVN